MIADGPDHGVLLDERQPDVQSFSKAYELSDRPVEIVVRQDWLAKDSGRPLEAFAIIFLLGIGFAQLAFTLT